ncbi:MAG: hypothetical protein QXQ70_03155 [Candidatus Caldarchaeum sp.]
MDWRDYFWFVVIGFLAFIIGGAINQVLGLSGSQNIVVSTIAFLIPMTILYLLYHRLRKRV